MANKALSMLQIRRLLMLLQEARSIREIQRFTGIHRTTIKSYTERFRNSGKSFDELLNLPDSELAVLLHPPRSTKQADERYSWLSERLEHYGRELQRRHVTKLILWEEYLQEQPDGYRYAQFCQHLDRYLQRHQPTMPQVHLPGDQLQIDFAGDMLRYYDVSQKEWIDCPVLLCTLPFSALFYGEPLVSSRQEHLVVGLNHALHYLGGVPKNVLSDNMAQVVTKPSRYEPVFTDLMEQWAQHYRINLQATRPAKPKDKPSVEKSVHIAYQQIYARMRNEYHTSLKSLSHRFMELLEMLNNRVMSAYGKSRMERFIAEEKAQLRALPQDAFVYKYQTTGKVKKNYHVMLGQDWHQYSVPHEYIGKEVRVVYDDDAVEIFFDYQRIALHRRNLVRNGYSTNDAHMPESHRHYLIQKGWTPQDFIDKGRLIGPCTEEVVIRLISARTFPEQAYDACIGLLRLKQGFGVNRLEAACALALKGPKVSYRIVQTILDNNRDKTMISQPESSPTLPFHENIRGKHAYN